jgi:diguanylate cyclase (GGDEF)-like protein
MSLVVARKKRTALYLSVAGLLVMACAVSGVSARDPDGLGLRVGMVMLTAGLALWLPWQAVLVAALAVWFAPNYLRTLTEEWPLFGTYMLLELPGILGLAGFTVIGRMALRRLENENILVGATSEEYAGVDPDTGVYEEHLLRPAVEMEIARARRFNRQFAVVLVGIDEMRQRFDYRDQEAWNSSFIATAMLLRSTRARIDRAYRYGPTGFALILPESGEREVMGLTRRLRRVARSAKPGEGQPGGPLPIHFGATFYPNAATTTDDLLRRAEIALRVAEKTSTRIQLDGAEAPDLPSPETLRGEDDTASFEKALSESLAAVEADAVLEQVQPQPVAATQADVAGVASPAAVAEQAPEAGEPERFAEPIPLPVAFEAIASAHEAPPEVDEAWEEQREPEAAPYPEPIPFPVASEWKREVAEETAAGRDSQLVAASIEDAELSPVAEQERAEAEWPPFQTAASAQPERENGEIAARLEPVEEPAAPVAERSDEGMRTVAATLEPAPEPVALLAPVAQAAAAAPGPDAAASDAQIVDLMKHLDETLAMIKSLRTGTGP